MYGAIIGDLAGSIYEFGQIREISPISIDKTIEENSFFSDDTILTIAILDAILNEGNYEDYIKKYIEKYKDYKPDFKPYFKTPFSPQLMKWCKGEIEGLSKGNGALMRISPIGYLFNNENDIIKEATLATIPSHHSIDALEAVKIVSLIIYYGRMGLSKEEIMCKLNISLNDQPFTKFNTTCHETLPNCLYALFTSDCFDEAIRKVISYGGDTDTNACIVGSMAEALYGIEDHLIFLAKKRLPKNFNLLLESAYSKMKTNKKLVHSSHKSTL